MTNKELEEILRKAKDRLFILYTEESDLAKEAELFKLYWDLLVAWSKVATDLKFNNCKGDN